MNFFKNFPLFFFLSFSFSLALPINNSHYIKEKVRYYHKINNGKRGNEIYIYENGKNKTRIIETKNSNNLNLYNIKINMKRGKNNKVQVYRIIDNVNVQSSVTGGYSKTKRNNNKNLNIGAKTINVNKTKKVYQVIENVKIKIRKK